MLPPETVDTVTLGTYAWAFGQGVLVDLTPCVYPLIPITVAVFGGKGVSRGRALFLATAYVLGMATLYTGLGVIVALSGAQFGAWLGNPVVVLPLVALLLAFAASMFGAFDLQLPSSIQTRLNSVGGAGPVGAFVMGLVSGLISAPCTGPVLLSLLAFIARESAGGENVAFGASLLFAYSLGMGTLFFAVALGVSLFRPGRWMMHIKSIFGIGLILMALWFLAPLTSELRGILVYPEWGLRLGLTICVLGLVLGAVHLGFDGTLKDRLRKAVGVLLVVVGAQAMVNNLLYVPTGSWQEVETIDELESALRSADERLVPVLIDFRADYCTPCVEMEVLTFHDEEIAPALERRFELIKIDLVPETDEKLVMADAFGGRLIPSVLLYPSSARLSDHLESLRAGKPMPEPAIHLRSFTSADDFAPLMASVH